MSMFTDLAKPFPASAISWRAQTMKADGSAALALAYIDARDVMNRLDDVCGPEGWQCDYPHAGSKTICRIGIKVGDEWIWKANGAGDTDVEAEKGATSDAFKRAAVLWKIGRYLYDVEAVWADCEPMKDRDGNLLKNAKGKPQFKKWTTRGLAQLDAALSKVIPHVAPRKEPTQTEMDGLVASISQLSEASGVTIQTICERANVSSLPELSETAAHAIIKKLKLTIEQNTREAA